ncbi:class I SAM-dependent methyltransferase [Actinoplanes rectilineatus]|uniref:class I SAM-dependent methyltransferase n=1 Tax=Actinoplanes rectilineatus TaxID=113571 RepID=UPI000696D094|nr:class I SAM-dependent methyltransferase [Actinoplanes rectilineatus]
MPSTALDPVGVAGRRAAWDTVMTGFVPGLPALERVIGTVTEGLHGGPPTRVLDLGGGPGLLAERMAARWPGARVGLVDIDPVLLALARTALPGAVDVIDADLTAPAWTAAAGGGYDLVTAVMTVHYLDPAPIRTLYRAIRRVLAPGGLLVVADLMPDDHAPTVMRALDPVPGEATAELAWTQWWGELTAAAEFAPLLAARSEVFRDRPTAEFAGGPAWHAQAARAAGFAESGLLWRDGRHAALACRRT